MRCVHCGCNKDAGAFSGAQKKKAVGKRRCISCAAAAATGDDVGSTSVAARASSVASAGAAQRAVSPGADNTLSTTLSTAATPASGTADGKDITAPPARSRGAHQGRARRAGSSARAR